MYISVAQRMIYTFNIIIIFAGDNLYINITAHVAEDEWIALGLSDDTRMGNDDVVAVYKNMSTQSFSAVSLLDPQRMSQFKTI